eukprot:scaffold116724_cov72-Phaeocystis_antarctica.AAC.2
MASVHWSLAALICPAPCAVARLTSLSSMEVPAAAPSIWRTLSCAQALKALVASAPASRSILTHALRCFTEDSAVTADAATSGVLPLSSAMSGWMAACCSALRSTRRASTRPKYAAPCSGVLP